MILASHGLIASQITQFVGLLDLYPSAAAAYSLRKLRTAYTGSAIRVRRTDLSESDIGFTSTGALDTTALLAFTGTGALNNGFVTTWYDQSGNGRDATQTTAVNQPQIVSAGSIVTVSGIGAANPSLTFGTTRFLTRAFLNFTDYSMFNVQKLSNVLSTQKVAYQNGTSGGWGLNSGSGSGTTYSLFEAGVADHNFGTTSTNLRIISGIRVQASSILNGYINSTLFTMSPSPVINPSGSLGIGALPNGNLPFIGNQSELIFYSTNQTTNISGIQSNINSFYGIY
jgi:hypothetical protein